MGKHKPPPKTRWHSLSLQSLAPQKFCAIVNRILQGDLAMIAAHPPHHGKKVLVTDDNGDHLEVIVEYLETDLGVVVDIARSSGECLRKLKTKNYDLLILDYRLPKHDGLWVIDQICRRGQRVPVLMVTSFYSDTLRERIRRDYPVDVMPKTNSFRLIARRAGHMLATTCAGPAA